MILIVTFPPMKWQTQSSSVKKQTNKKKLPGVSTFPRNTWAFDVLDKEGVWGGCVWGSADQYWLATPELIVVTLVLWAQAENCHLAQRNQRVLLHSGKYPAVPATLHGTTFFLFSDLSQHEKNRISSFCGPATHTSPLVPFGDFLMTRHVQ